MEESLGDVVLGWALSRWAYSVEGTEAIAYEILGKAQDPQLRQVAYVRGGDHSEELEAKARKALAEMAAEAVREGACAVTTVGGAEPDGKTMYCLTVLIRDATKQRKPRAVFCIVTRCPSLKEARARLSVLQGTLRRQ